MNGMLFGKPFDYWLELDLQAKQNNEVDLVLQNAQLRAKVSMYEEHIKRMSDFKDKVENMR